MSGDEGTSGSAAPPVATFSFKKKKKGKSAAQKKRTRTDSDSDGGGGVVKVEKKKKALNSFTTGGESKAGWDREVANAAGGVVSSTREAAPAMVAGGSTYYNQENTDEANDARAILERNIKVNQEGETTADTGLYKGMAAYKNHVAKKESQVGANKHTGTQGPVRAPTFLRTTNIIDYQPDVCKDYKETGFCGFGDSCKFLHDRGDYKSGYALEKEWEEKQKKKREKEMLGEWGDGAGSDSNDEEYAITSDDDLPHACFICREGFKNPVVTNCKHYFCEACALSHYKSDAKCAACGKDTGGVFNFAKALVKKMEQKGLLKGQEENGAPKDGEEQAKEGDDDEESDY
ncbi:unnamed protein product, partial [Chrysoparadoxa australica]